MLQNESQKEAQDGAASPPGQRRVTPDELTAALEALESRRQEQARQVQQTVAIGDVVQELGLDVTPEEVWQQVQAQRAQKPPAPPPVAESKPANTVNETLHAAAQQAHKIAGQASAAAAATYVVAQAAQARRQAKRRGPGGVLGILIALGVVGTTWFHSGHGLMINGDNAVATYSGNRQATVINGDHETITLRGDCGTLVVNGDGDRVIITGGVKRIVTDGDRNIITWAQAPDSPSPTIVDNGDGNRITTFHAVNPGNLKSR